MRFVQLNQGPGDEITRLSFDEIDKALQGVDLHSLENEISSRRTTAEIHSAEERAENRQVRYRVRCLTMRKQVDQEALQACLDENSRLGWRLKSITRSDSYSTMREAMDIGQNRFELIVVFEQ